MTETRAQTDHYEAPRIESRTPIEAPLVGIGSPLPL